MELLAAGRDCEVFDRGDGTVLRRSRDGRSLAAEGEVMAHVAGHGFPCPRVHAVDDGALVLDLVPGPTLLHDLLSDPTPARAAGAGAVLADLHRRLHAVPPRGAGPCVLHRDLHPENVLLGPDGPVLIDWTNATEGAPGVDIALSWLILVPYVELGGGLVEPMIDALHDGAGRDAAESGLDDAAAYRLADRNLTDGERTAVEALLRSR